VELIFGVGAIMETSSIGMQVTLTGLESAGCCERVGIEETSLEILGVKVPSLGIPVSPGRNLAVLIEVAALNQRLKSQGYFAAREFNNSLIRSIKKAQRKG